MTDFEHWWYHEGSGPKLPSEDFEEHCKRMCKIAWSNGAYKSSEVLDSLLDEAKLLADDRPVEVGNLPKWTLDAEHMLRRLVKAFNATPQPNGPKGYAGITIWGGDAAVTKVFTEEEIKYAIDTRALINYSVQQCLDALTSHDTKEKP